MALQRLRISPGSECSTCPVRRPFSPLRRRFTAVPIGEPALLLRPVSPPLRVHREFTEPQLPLRRPVSYYQFSSNIQSEFWVKVKIAQEAGPARSSLSGSKRDLYISKESTRASSKSLSWQSDMGSVAQGGTCVPHDSAFTVWGRALTVARGVEIGQHLGGNHTTGSVRRRCRGWKIRGLRMHVKHAGIHASLTKWRKLPSISVFYRRQICTRPGEGWRKCGNPLQLLKYGKVFTDSHHYNP